MLKKIVVSLLAITVVIVTSLYLWAHTAVPLPQNIEQTIAKVMSAPLPDYVDGKTGFATSEGLRIWYEVKAPINTMSEPKGTVLFINGMGASGVFWQPRVYKSLQKMGYQVVVSDHRDIGQSDRVKDWSRENAYKLEDMAKDNLAILDTLGIKQAHILGVSLGAMIAQEIAIHHPERIQSMVSISSTANYRDPEFPFNIEFGANSVKMLILYSFPQTELNMIKHVLGVITFLKGDKEINNEEIVSGALYELRKRNGFNPLASMQHELAMRLSGSRLKDLASVDTPALVVHGDKDPVLPIQQAKKYAKILSNAEALWVPGMGHIMAEEDITLVMKRVTEFLGKHSYSNLHQDRRYTSVTSGGGFSGTN